MADQREYVIFAQFDGATVATEALPWSAGSGQGNPADQRFRTLGLAGMAAITVGLFPPTILGRASTHSLVRVWGDSPQLGDVVQVFSSLDPLNANPIDVPRGPAVPIAPGPQLATILELDMKDVLSITTGGRIGVHVEVLDMDEQQHLLYLLKKFESDTGCCNNLAGATETRVLEVPPAGVDLASWTADALYVDATTPDADPSGTLRLPLLTSVELGARVRVQRTLGSDWFQIGAQLGDTINGSANGKVVLVGDATSAWIERDARGWQSTIPAVALVPLAAVGTQNLPVPDDARLRVEWQITAPDDFLTLPTDNFVAVDQEYEVTVTRIIGPGGTVRPFAGGELDGVADLRIPMARVGDTVIVRRVAGGGYQSLSNCAFLSRNVQTVTVDPGLGTSPGWRGLQVYRANFLATGNFTLPTAPMVGTWIRVTNFFANSTDVTLVGGPNLIEVGGASANAFLTLPNHPVDLVFVIEGLQGYWIGAS